MEFYRSKNCKGSFSTNNRETVQMGWAENSSGKSRLSFHEEPQQNWNPPQSNFMVQHTSHATTVIKPGNLL